MLAGLLLLSITSNYATPGVSYAQANKVDFQNDGSIVVAGSVLMSGITKVMTARYTAQGSVDGTYGNNGFTATEISDLAGAYGMVILNDDSIVTAGYGTTIDGTAFALVKYTADGVLDTSFNGSGIVTTFHEDGCTASGIVSQLDGKYVAHGVVIVDGTPTIMLARYNTNGSLDSSFGVSGIVTTLVDSSANAYAATLQADGKVVIGGYASSDEYKFLVARYTTADGSLDTSFNNSGDLPGTVTFSAGESSIARAIAIQPSDGKIVLGGLADGHFALARFNTDGTIDSDFGDGGAVNTILGSSSQIRGIAIQSDNKIVAAGLSTTSFALARYNTDGSLDTTFNSAGSKPGTIILAIGNVSQAYSVAINDDDRILVSGTANNGAIVACFNSNGTLYTTFGGNNNGYISFPNSSQGPNIFGISDVNIAEDAAIQYKKLNLTNQIVAADISSTAALPDSKLAAIQTAGKVLNSATTASSSNVAASIVARDALGNFVANVITADLEGDVSGSASNNLLKSGDTMTGTLIVAAGSANNPSIQFADSPNAGFSANADILVLSTNGFSRVEVDENGAVLINNPESGVGFTAGGGADISGDLVGSGNITFNTDITSLYAVGSTQGPLVKLFAGADNTGGTGTVTINYSAAGFSNPPYLVTTSSNGTANVLGVGSVTSAGASVTSDAVLNVPFNYVAIGI
jgi:uncharacterized delta-60 repeat protein